MTTALEGKVAVVTGSGQGVGRGIAIALAREGAKVVTNDLAPKAVPKAAFRPLALKGAAPTLNEAETTAIAALAGDADSTAAEIVAEGGEAVACYADVSNYETAGHLITTAIEEFGRIDILVNNAAGTGFGPFLNTRPDDWAYILSTKLTGTYNCMHHAVPHMIEQGYGRIINASSDAWTGFASLGAYGAANAGVVALSKSTAKELSRSGITVNVYCPQAASPAHVTFAATFRTLLEKSGGKMQYNEKLMRESEEAHGPAENLTFLAYLATDEAASITGTVCTVTGNGRVSLYSDPAHVSHITKPGAPWTIDELRKQVPDLLTGYAQASPEF